MTTRPAAKSIVGTTALVKGRSSGSPPLRARSRGCRPRRNWQRRDPADARAVRRHGVEPDEVVPVEFVGARLGQPIAAGEDLDARQRGGRLARLDALELDDEHLRLHRPQPLEREPARRAASVSGP